MLGVGAGKVVQEGDEGVEVAQPDSQASPEQQCSKCGISTSRAARGSLFGANRAKCHGVMPKRERALARLATERTREKAFSPLGASWLLDTLG